MKQSRSGGRDNPAIEKYRSRFEGVEEGEPLPFAEARELFEAFVKLDHRLGRIARISDNYQSEVKRLVQELRATAANVKTLKGFIPICASCKKIRSDDGYWKQLEQYIAEHSEALFSHGMCPECTNRYRAMMLKSKGVEQPSLAPIPILEEADLNDPVIGKGLGIVNNEHFVKAPLYEEFRALFQKYVRLTKRMSRIAKISDNYHAQFRQMETERQRLGEQARREAQARAELLDEIEQRTNNNLMAIAQMLRSEQSHARTDGRGAESGAALGRLQQRIEAMTLTQRMLAESRLAPLHVSALAERIVHAARALAPDPAALAVHIPPSTIKIAPRQTGNLALVLNELALNTIGHALPGRAAVRVDVRVEREEGRIRLAYRDDGPGYPAQVLHGERGGVGLELIRNLVAAMPRGELALANDSGAVTEIRIGAD